MLKFIRSDKFIPYFLLPMLFLMAALGLGACVSYYFQHYGLGAGLDFFMIVVWLLIRKGCDLKDREDLNTEQLAKQ
jgi:hypothetical protein